MKTKWILTSLLTMAALFVALSLWYRWDSETNHGLAFGYYSQYNTVSNALSRIPGVTIVATGYNADVTLEEFGFDVKAANKSTLHIWFNEDDPIRRMSGEQLKQVLTARISDLLTTNQTE